MIDTTNNICRMLQRTANLKDLAPFINWSEVSERHIEKKKFSDSTRDILYKELNEQQLIELMHPNLVKNEYDRVEDIPFFYVLQTGRVEFLKSYIGQLESLGEDISSYKLQQAIDVSVDNTYKSSNYYEKIFDPKSSKSINDWFDMVQSVVDIMMQHEKPGAYHTAKDVELDRSACLFLVKSAKAPKKLSETMLEYAVDNLDIDHILKTPHKAKVVEILNQKFLEQKYFLYGNTSMLYPERDYFERVVRKDIAQHIDFVEKFSKVATGITKDMSHNILEALAVQCPVMFLWAKEHFPDYQFSIKGKKYTYDEIEGIYAYCYQFADAAIVGYKESVQKEQLTSGKYNSLSEHYNVRRIQYKELGYTLSTVENFKPSIIDPDVRLQVYPGLARFSRIDRIEREKVNLALQVGNIAKKGSYKI